MSEEKELKLACLHQAGGDLDHAQRLFDWVSGSVRATPDSEAAEVSAPKQDKPQQSFNYRHPSKYGTDVPRRCYLEELTPEERAIRDLVDTVERLGAHPLLTATVIQLMKAGEDLADWVDIGLRDKAIAALSPGNDLGLLDLNLETASPEFASEQGPPVQIVHEERWPYSVSYTIAESGFGSGAYEHLYEARDDYEAFKLEPNYLTVVLKHRGKVIDTFARPIGADVPEDDRDETWTPPPGYTYIPTQGERCVCVNLMQDGIGNFFCCNQRGEPSADAERTSNDSQATDQDREEQADLLLENQPGVSDEGTPVLDAGPPSIRRSDIPEGVAVETFTDAGVETVKIGGLTHIVEAAAETTAKAAYAPVNEDDGLMWSNAFKAEAEAKAEPEQDKRPFWVFGKKELA